MAEASRKEPCKHCGEATQRVYSFPQINMGNMVAEGYKKTNEPADWAKEDSWSKDMVNDISKADIVSYPDHTRRMGKVDTR